MYSTLEEVKKEEVVKKYIDNKDTTLKDKEKIIRAFYSKKRSFENIIKLFDLLLLSEKTYNEKINNLIDMFYEHCKDKADIPFILNNDDVTIKDKKILFDSNFYVDVTEEKRRYVKINTLNIKKNFGIKKYNELFSSIQTLNGRIPNIRFKLNHLLDEYISDNVRYRKKDILYIELKSEPGIKRIFLYDSTFTMYRYVGVINDGNSHNISSYLNDIIN